MPMLPTLPDLGGVKKGAQDLGAAVEALKPVANVAAALVIGYSAYRLSPYAAQFARDEYARLEGFSLSGLLKSFIPGLG